MKRWQQRGGENPEDQTEGDEHIEKKMSVCRRLAILNTSLG
jgi:hypothetical protein